MGRCMRQYDKDHMKMTILKQEETFRQQVYELHRLYRVQKLLMNDLKRELKRQKKSSETQARCNTETETDLHQPYYSHQNRISQHKMLDLELPAEKYFENGDEVVELDLTLAIGSNRQRKKENSVSSDSGASFTSCSTDNGNDCRLFQVPLMNLDGYRSERKNKFHAKKRIMEKTVNRPPWMLQCLSLNTA